MRRLLLLGALLAGGCGATSFGGVWRYRPLVAAGTASRYATLEAAERALRRLPAVPVPCPDDPFTLVAYSEQTRRSRDRIEVKITEAGEVHVDLRTEIQVGGRWRAEEHVCDGYAYAREQALVDRILGSVAPASAVAWNELDR